MSPIELDHTSAEPKYQQVMSFIKRAIDNNELKLGDKIPSVNEVAESTGIAKKTVVQATLLQAEIRSLNTTSSFYLITLALIKRKYMKALKARLMVKAL
jgi:DNA-binding transcriptional regulator YhcF (GntR family)